MNYRSTLIHSCLLLLLLALATTALAQAPEAINTKAKESLRGLVAVKVVVEVTPTAEVLGLSLNQVQEIVTSRLREAGIQVDERLEANTPILYVRVMCLQTGRTEFVSLTDVQLRQEVTPKRLPSVTEVAATWQNSSLGVQGGLPQAAAIKRKLEGVGSVIDWFVRDYRSVNAK